MWGRVAVAANVGGRTVGRQGAKAKAEARLPTGDDTDERTTPKEKEQDVREEMERQRTIEKIRREILRNSLMVKQQRHRVDLETRQRRVEALEKTLSFRSV
jgi:hypothetical protein